MTRYKVRKLINERMEELLDETTSKLEEVLKMLEDEDYSREQIASEVEDILYTLM